MLRSALALALLGGVAALETKPLAAQPKKMQAVKVLPTTLAALKAVEEGFVDQLFTMANELVDVGMRQKQLAADGVGTTGRQPSQSTAAKYAQPKLERIKREYHFITPEMQAELAPKWEAKCAVVLEQMVSVRLQRLAELGLSNETLSVDIATHFQVQCPGQIPIGEAKCDEYATALYNILHKGRPINVNSALLQRDAPLVVPPPGIKTGNDWCKSFFVDFFTGVVAQLKAATPTHAPIGPGGKYTPTWNHGSGEFDHPPRFL